MKVNHCVLCNTCDIRVFYFIENSIKHPVPPPRLNAPSKTLDEITNKVYEDILQEKSENAFSKQKSDKGSVKVSITSLI